MAKAKKRAGKKRAAKKKVARRRPGAKRKAVKRKPRVIARPAAAPMAQRPVVIPGAWPFPMGSKP